MAEIRSTMEMVMARAAKIAGHDDSAAGDSEERVKDGMRLGAAYLRGETIELGPAVAAHSGTDQTAVRQGIVQALLRNIILARDEEQAQQAERAIQGLLEVGEAGSDLLPIFRDMKTILGRYREHKQQLRKQLEQQFAQQMEMMQQSLAQQTGMAMRLEPAQHPKFQAEWQRLQMELGDQYGRALDQHKSQVRQRLAG